MDAPTDSNLDQYLRELKAQNVSMLVRTCEPTYSVEKLKKAGIAVRELPFADGAPPPDEVVDQWLGIIREVFESKAAASAGSGPTIAIHCVAGLGRAPAMVAIGLIEKGMDPMDAIQMIRDKRRGAINRKQVRFLTESYQRRSSGGAFKCCTII